MSRDKQIEEMAKILCTDCDMGKCMVDGFECLKGYCSKRERIEALYNVGYRKVVEQSETARECQEGVDNGFSSSVTESATRAKVAEEIFAEIEDVLNNIGYFDELDFEALKKKYNGKDTNVTTNTEDK